MLPFHCHNFSPDPTNATALRHPASPGLSGLGVAPVHVLEIPIQQPVPPCIELDRRVAIWELFNPPPTGLHYNELTMRNYKIKQVAGIGIVSLSKQTQFSGFDSG
jgi:hypothetical protein